MTLQTKQRYYLTILINRYTKCILKIKDMDIVPKDTISNLTGLSLRKKYSYNPKTCVLCDNFSCYNCPHNVTINCLSGKSRPSYNNLFMINESKTKPKRAIKAIEARIEYLKKLRDKI